ncbi:hypothetical protein D3C73_1134870 [compost metagenome]
MNRNRIRPIITEPIIASEKKPAPVTIPATAAQNRKIRSVGSLIGVLNRTMESAPTIPSDSTRFELIAIMTVAVIMVMPISETLKLLE